MSSLEEGLVAGDGAEFVAVLPETRLERVDRVLAKVSDHLNPILVKEARQALRSRQFTMTFFLLLAAGWAWSILGLALIGPAAYYNAEGPAMFFPYYVILSAALLIAAPYFAYHSLSAERQDRTFELVSITALNARQILTGKLCGIALQMMVYLSALFPCLAFTYLLRGLDILTVILVVVYTCLLSLGLSMVGLLLATLSPTRQRQIIQGVIFAALLVWVFIMMVALMSDLMSFSGVPYDDPEFWQANLALATLYANAFALVFLAARAELTTAYQNCSTALRVALLISQLSIVGWTAWALLSWGTNIIYGCIVGSTILWYLAGVFMTGEPYILSPRVKRDLPQTAAGRALLSWFAPGPGTGYMFALANMLAMTMLVGLADTDVGRKFLNLPAFTGYTTGMPRQMRPGVMQAALVATSYVAIYLGLGKLILQLLRRVDEVRILLRVLVHLLLLMLGAGVPWVVQLSNPATRNLSYSVLQITNPFWTLYEYTVAPVPPTSRAILVMLPLAAVLVWVANLPSLARELMQVRIARPPRVAEDDAAQLPPAVPERTSPWDDEPVGA